LRIAAAFLEEKLRIAATFFELFSMGQTWNYGMRSSLLSPDVGGE